MNKLRLPMTGIYLVLFSLYSLMTRFTWTASLIDGSINAILYRLILVLGCLFALWWLIDCRKEFLPPSIDLCLLGGFVIVLCISTWTNHSYNLMDNLLGIVTFGFQLVLFYLMGRTLTDREWQGMVRNMILPCSLLWDAACAGSLLQFFMNMYYTDQYAADHGIVRQGIMDGRLFGLFSDPNFAAFTSLLLLFGLWHTLRLVTFTATRIFIWFSIVLNVIYIVMSNSRTVYLSVAGSILFYVLLSVYKKKCQKENLTGFAAFRCLLVRGIATLVLLAAIHVVTLAPMQGIAKLISPERDVEVEMMREDVDAGNISNNRFTIWKAYLELYREKPLFGFSTRGALPYAEQTYPDGYLAETKYVTHNSYLSLLVGGGAIGFLIMAVFMVLLFLRIIRRIRSREEIPDTWLLFAVWLVSVLIFCICFHDIFFTMNIETMLFFCSLGFLWKNQ